MRGACFLGAAAFALAVSLGGAARAQDAAQAPVVIAPDRAPAEINPAGRAITLTAPVMDGEAYLGDATVTLGTDGSVSFSAARLLALIEPRIRPELAAELRARLAANGRLTGADLQAVGAGVRYNPQMLQVELAIAAASRTASVIGLGDGPGRTVAYMKPAEFSAYLNLRGSLDLVEQGLDEGLAPPVMFIDGAARWHGVVLESELNLQPGSAGPDYQRRGTRLVYDDRERLVRWSAGDQLTISRGFQSAPEIAGLSASRRYSILDPQTVIRPRGSRSFQLERRSMVEVRINGQLVRRIELDPGGYDLQDFPFAQGANDIELTITDDAGRTERINYNIFLDQAQLAEGLERVRLLRRRARPARCARSGLQRHAGVQRVLPPRPERPAHARRQPPGRHARLDGRRRGVRGDPDRRDRQPSPRPRTSTASGSGWAGIVNFQRAFARGGISADALSLSVEARSRNFAPIGIRAPENPYSLIVGRELRPLVDVRSLRQRRRALLAQAAMPSPTCAACAACSTWNISPPSSTSTARSATSATARGDSVGTLLTLTYRFNRRSSVRADYDSRYDRGRLSYQTFGGTGVGSYTVNADVEHSDIGVGTSLNGNLLRQSRPSSG